MLLLAIRFRESLELLPDLDPRFRFSNPPLRNMLTFFPFPDTFTCSTDFRSL